MKQFITSKRGIMTVVLAIALIAAAIWGSTLVLGKNTAAADGEGDSTVVLVSQMCENPEAAVRNLLLKQGFKKSEFVVGEDKFDLSLKEATEEGTGSFGASATTAQKLTDFLASDEAAAKEVLKHSIDAAGVTKEQALDPSNWVGFQMLVESKWDGNTAYSDGQVQEVGTRNNAKGDLGWVLVNPDDCKKVEKASSKDAAEIELRVALVRGGCVNPQFLPPKPDRPGDTPKGGCKHNCNPPKEECPPGQVPYEGRCAKKAGQNDGHSDQPVGDNPQGGTPGAGPEPAPPKPGPKPVDNSPAPDPTPGGYDSGSGSGSGTPGGSTCDSSGCSGGGATGPSPGTPPVVDDGPRDGDPGGFE